MKHRSTQYILAFALLLFTVPLSLKAADVHVPMTAERWDIRAKNPKFEKHMGQDSLFAEGGSAAVKGAAMLNGTVEFDIAMQDKFSFPGINFRVQNDANYEEFYLRPFESGKDDACQYSPVFNGVSGWQLYSGPGYSGAIRLPTDRWTHVKLLIDGDHGEIYIDGGSEPAFVISQLLREPRSGGLHLALDKAWFANFVYSTDIPKLRSKPSVPFQPAVDPGTVSKWMISNVFSEESLQKTFKLPDELMGTLRWTVIGAENRHGLVNIARGRVMGGNTNTVLSRVTINSETDQIKRFSFGFSDRGRLYLNGRLLFSANDAFRTRDFRFLGTIGLFYDVYLPLGKGRNTIDLAVSEDFGGWGVQGRFDDVGGLSFEYR